MRRKYKRWLSKRDLKIIIPVVFVAGVLLFTALELTNTIDIINRSQPATDSDSSVENTSAPSGSTENSNSSPSAIEDTPKSSAVQPPSGQPPISPSQSTYVSNHQPNSKTDMLQSVCVTSPGATCTISFQKSGATKSLQPTVADSSGSVYWTWSPQELGLSSGSWVISAEASLNGKVKSSQDIINLQVP